MTDPGIPKVLELYRNFARFPMGKWLFSKLVCLRAPYFSSIAPRFAELGPGAALVTMRNRRRVRNHIGTVHAIAICNLCELAAGTMTEVSMPRGMRWIPKGMTVEYLAPAKTSLRASATIPGPVVFGDAFELPVSTEVTDRHGTVVVRAVIRMWISPRKTSGKPISEGA
ncbi:MAG: DUF4442 domain-containing protein [Gammaproteobacteria bacterium]|nr:DUF4442 domain-containing protein [Gammaproteobacteria bacterium]